MAKLFSKSPFTEEQKKTAVWQILEVHLRERLDLLRVRNDNQTLNEHKTATLRGSISELKYILSLGDERQLPPPEDEFKD